MGTSHIKQIYIKRQAITYILVKQTFGTTYTHVKKTYKYNENCCKLKICIDIII